MQRERQSRSLLGRREPLRAYAHFEDPVPFISNLELMHRDYYPRVHEKLIAKMERLVRAIALQFTLGDHAERAGELGRTSIV